MADQTSDLTVRALAWCARHGRDAVRDVRCACDDLPWATTPCVNPATGPDGWCDECRDAVRDNDQGDREMTETEADGYSPEGESAK